MLGIIYLILAEILGYKASKILIEEGTKFSFINRIWLTLPASFGVGTLLLTWVVYIISWFFSVVGKVENPLLYGNAIGMAGVLIFIILIEVQNIYDVLCFLHERWNSVFWTDCIWRLCATYGDDTFFFHGE